MKAPAILACLVPWILLALAVCYKSGGGIADMGLIWLICSPLLIAGTILVSYRTGQFDERNKEK